MWSYTKLNRIPFVTAPRKDLGATGNDSPTPLVQANRNSSRANVNVYSVVVCNSV